MRYRAALRSDRGEDEGQPAGGSRPVASYRGCTIAAGPSGYQLVRLAPGFAQQLADLEQLAEGAFDFRPPRGLGVRVQLGRRLHRARLCR